MHHAAAPDFKVSKPKPGTNSAWATALAASLLLALAAPLAAQNCCSQEPAGPALRVSPRIRYDRLPEAALPALNHSQVDAFLAEPLVLAPNALPATARIVASQEDRVLLGRGDRIYALGPAGEPLIDDPGRPPQVFQVVRQATALKDPISGALLGYEAQTIGRARLLRSQSAHGSGGTETPVLQSGTPASLDILSAREEIRVGDLLIPETFGALPQRYLPRAARLAVQAHIVSVYGGLLTRAAQQQVVVINRGRRDGLDSGHLLSVMADRSRPDHSASAARQPLGLPAEPKGLLVVLRPFDQLSYALVLESTDALQVGDRLVSQR